MSSGDNSKKAAGSGGTGGQSKSKKLATACGVSKPAPAINPATQPEYIVEKIAGKRYWNGRPQVLVKWQDYPPEENTWEPMENIGNCMVLLADFEAELYKSRERRKRLKKALAKKSDEKLSDATASTSHATAHVERRVESGKSMGPKANLTNSAIGSAPKPNASQNMGSIKSESSHNALGKSSKKQEPGPSSSFYKRALPYPITYDVESSSSGSSSDFSESDAAPISQLATSKAGKEMISRDKQNMARKDGAFIKTEEMQNQTVYKKIRRHSNSPNSEDSIEKTLKSIHSNPMVRPISPLASSPEISKQLVKKCQINQTPTGPKKNKKKSPKKSETQESDDDSDAPFMPSHTRHNKLSEATGWKVPLRKAPFGLARGLELDKIVHNFKVLDKIFLFVNWKGLAATDVVPLEELKVAYPAQIIQYFENMKRITKDPKP